jgi:hypothetical protein
MHPGSHVPRDPASGMTYDVVYLDDKRRPEVVATGLNRDSAAGLARAEARRRHAGRMFLAGSENAPPTHAVVIIRSESERAALRAVAQP